MTEPARTTARPAPSVPFAVLLGLGLSGLATAAAVALLPWSPLVVTLAGLGLGAVLTAMNVPR